MAVKVTKLIKSKHMEDRWYAELDNGATIKANLALIADYSIYTGREFTDEECADLTRAASLASARDRAFRILGARMLSRSDLIRRLREKGETEEDAVAAADFLESVGALDDEEFAGAVVRHYSRSGYGKAKIRDELYRRGVPRELWDAALDENMPHDTGAIDALVAKKLRGTARIDEKERKRLTDMLLRRGYSWAEAKSALDRFDISEDTDE